MGSEGATFVGNNHTLTDVRVWSASLYRKTRTLRVARSRWMWPPAASASIPEHTCCAIVNWCAVVMVSSMSASSVWRSPIGANLHMMKSGCKHTSNGSEWNGLTVSEGLDGTSR
jgi:hypothetical protein